MATACVANDKNVGVEDTDDEPTSGESSTSTTGVESTVTTSVETGTAESGTTGEDSGETRGESETGTTFVDTGVSESETSTSGGVDVQCGDAAICSDGDVCIVTYFPANCTELLDGEECRPGQMESQCGGIGFPCCCDPPPPPEFRCVTPSDCVGPASCECLGDVCQDGFECIAQGVDPEHVFACEQPAMP